MSVDRKIYMVSRARAREAFIKLSRPFRGLGGGEVRAEGGKCKAPTDNEAFLLRTEQEGKPVPKAEIGEGRGPEPHLLGFRGLSEVATACWSSNRPK